MTEFKALTGANPIPFKASQIRRPYLIASYMAPSSTKIGTGALLHNGYPRNIYHWKFCCKFTILTGALDAG